MNLHHTILHSHQSLSLDAGSVQDQPFTACNKSEVLYVSWHATGTPERPICWDATNCHRKQAAFSHCSHVYSCSCLADRRKSLSRIMKSGSRSIWNLTHGRNNRPSFCSVQSCVKNHIRPLSLICFNSTNCCCYLHKLIKLQSSLQWTIPASKQQQVAV